MVLKDIWSQHQPPQKQKETGFQAVPIEKFDMDGTSDVIGKDMKNYYDAYPSDKELLEKYPPVEIRKEFFRQKVSLESLTTPPPENDLVADVETLVEAIAQSALHIPPGEIVSRRESSDVHTFTSWVLSCLEFQIQHRNTTSLMGFDVDLKKFFQNLFQHKFVCFERLQELLK